jgi:uncharacterized membrane protein
MKRILKHISHSIILFTVLGLIYYFLEVIYRGHSHWEMLIIGGLCGLSLSYLNSFLSWKMPLVIQAVLGMLICLIIEFTSGCICNLALNLNLWNYNGLPFNLLGQIQLYYAGMWYVLSIVGIILDDHLRHWLFGEPMGKYIIF